MAKNKNVIPIIPDGLLQKFGVSKDEFMETFMHCHKDMVLIKKKLTPENVNAQWCIVLHIHTTETGGSFLYLAKSESSAVFSQPDEDMNNVVWFNKVECSQVIDYISSQRRNRCPHAIGTLKSYNPYTGELI